MIHERNSGSSSHQSVNQILIASEISLFPFPIASSMTFSMSTSRQTSWSSIDTIEWPIPFCASTFCDDFFGSVASVVHGVGVADASRILYPVDSNKTSYGTALIIGHSWDFPIVLHSNTTSTHRMGRIHSNIHVNTMRIYILNGYLGTKGKMIMSWCVRVDAVVWESKIEWKVPK